jgi:FKBP-type peptidyl-prolyl cis-trans isomerase FkpA
MQVIRRGGAAIAAALIIALVAWAGSFAVSAPAGAQTPAPAPAPAKPAPKPAPMTGPKTGTMTGPMTTTKPAPVTTPSGLTIIDTKVGTGATPRPGQTCVMHYTGWLYVNGKKGDKFDSSRDSGQPFEFKIGAHQVIAGWDEGIASMKVGGLRTLIIPPSLGYGSRGAGGVIPPNATLMFEVELLAVK